MTVEDERTIFSAESKTGAEPRVEPDPTGATAPSASRGATIDAVARIVADVRGVTHAITPTMRLSEDLGCTSFDMMVICVRLESELGATVDFAKLAGVSTVEDLTRALE